MIWSVWSPAGNSFDRRIETHPGVPSGNCGGRGPRWDGGGQEAERSTVAETILPDGRNLNQELVRAGLAWWYQR